MLNLIRKLFVNKKKDFIFEGKDGAPDVRYYYQGTKLIINKEDAIDRAIWVLNNSISEMKKDELFKQELRRIKNENR